MSPTLGGKEPASCRGRLRAQQPPCDLEFTPVNERGRFPAPWVGDRSLAVVCAYWAEQQYRVPAFLESLGESGSPDLNPSGVLLLDFCAGHSLSITNTMFESIRVSISATWHQDTLGRRSMIDFVVVSSDLRPYVLDTRVKRGAELSTDHHLVVSWIQLAEEEVGQTWQTQSVL
ncbi:hypothetical protein L3Q82_017891 [Scortum barcoo]|uniref:Uncharacterized protein n=1 Tax=Scortum barcoo TaxID=214431 RepID=A0ACB8VIK7_9TELE|nr:hypothetical protein L3Q82_017891 [Scortum barcoo]